MEALYRSIKEKGFALVAVNMGEGKDTVRRWVKQEGVTFPVLLDRNGAAGRAYRVFGTPTVFLVDRAGRLVGHAVGPRGWTTANGRALLNALLNAPAR